MAIKNYNQPLLPMYYKFIQETEKGKRLQKDGKVVAKSTLENYKALHINLVRFQTFCQKEFLINTNYKYTKRNFIVEKNRYSKFYKEFTDFLYSNNCTDNYVGMLIKILRSFFIYLNQVKGYQVGTFYKDFYSRKEEVPIVVLTQEQLQYLIYDNPFENILPKHLKITKDIFVLGCTIGLRFSDLMVLTWRNVQELDSKIYIVTKSIKTNTDTRIKLPQYAIDVLTKFKHGKGSIFPKISLNQFNKNIKKIAEVAQWTNEVGKIRSKRGLKKELKVKGKPYRFCDMITSHTMRRTAITTLLILGMPEPLVRKISGHSANSKEFFKYVKYSEAFLDSETDKAFDKLTLKIT